MKSVSFIACLVLCLLGEIVLFAAFPLGLPLLVFMFGWAAACGALYSDLSKE